MLFPESISNIEKTSHFDQKVFLKYFPSASIKEIKSEAIPNFVMEKFNHEALNFISDESKELNKKFFAVVTHNDGSITYIEQVQKTYDLEQLAEESTYLVDVHADVKSGYGEIRKNLLSTGFIGPFVGFTDTETDFQKKGLGERRILLMNALAESMYHVPLYSDELLRPKAESIWLKLCEKNLAEKIQTDESYRYVVKQRID